MVTSARGQQTQQHGEPFEKTTGKQDVLAAARARQSQQQQPEKGSAESLGIVNHIQLSGWLITDVQFMVSKNDKEMLKTFLSIGKNRPGINVIMMLEKAGEAAAEMALACEKGDKVVVEGEISFETYNEHLNVTIFATSIT